MNLEINIVDTITITDGLISIPKVIIRAVKKLYHAASRTICRLIDVLGDCAPNRAGPTLLKRLTHSRPWL